MARFWFEKYKTYLVTLPLAMVGHFEVALFVFELQIPEVHLAPKVSRHNSLNKRFLDALAPLYFFRYGPRSWRVSYKLSDRPARAEPHSARNSPDRRM